MKKLILVLVAVIAFGNSYTGAQNISRKVISFSGEYNEAQGYYLSWTSGETVSQTIYADGYYLTQGFQQPSLLNITTPLQPVPTSDSISVYPNPVSDNLTILFSVKEVMDYRIEIISLDGRKLWIKEIKFTEVSFHEETVDFNPFFKGLYLINIFSPDRQVNKTFKIEKIKH